MAVYTKVKTRENSYSVVDQSICSVQTAPINYSAVLEYQRYRFSSVGYPQPWYSTPASNLLSTLRSNKPGQAQAYDRLMYSARGKASANLGVSLVQSREALSMISKRCRSIYAAIRSVKRGQLRLALNQLGYGDTDRWMKSYGKWEGARNDWSSLWLEINFGWSPLLADIKDACDVLASEPPTSKARGSSRAESSIDYSDIKKNWEHIESAVGTHRLFLYGDVKSFNANQLVYSNLGLTNPALIAWDAVPFSFVVDWFIPISKWLKAYDPAFNVELVNTGRSVVIRSMGSRSIRAWDFQGALFRDEQSFSDCFEMTRQRYTPTVPSLGQRMLPLSGSLWQATTSVALVFQQLRSAPGRT